MVTFHEVIINTNFVIGVTLNISLLWVIRQCSQTKIGTYRYVLVILTIFNLIYGFQHTFITPKIYNYETTAILWVERTELFGYNTSDINISIFGTFFYLSLLVQAYHFVYRYINICRPSLCYLLSDPRFISLAFVIYLLAAAFWMWFWLCSLGRTPQIDRFLDHLVRRDLNRTIQQIGYTGPSYKLPDENGVLQWHTPHLFSFGIIIVAIVITTAVIVYCGVSMIYGLRNSQMSRKTLELQKSLLKLLICQTIAPVLCSYIPCALAYGGPIFSNPLNFNFTVDLPTFYPVLEPIITVYFVADYRQFFLKQFHKHTSTTHPEKISVTGESEGRKSGTMTAKIEVTEKTESATRY